MYRILTWLTVLGIVFAARDLVTALDKLPVSHAAVAQLPVIPVDQSTVAQSAPVLPSDASSISNTGTTNVSTMAVARPVKTFEQQCEENLGATQVSSTLGEFQITYNFTKRVYDLTQTAGNSKSLTLGLTRAQATVNFVWDMQVLQDPVTKRVCMRPKIMIVTNPGEQLVFVGREFAKGTCAFEEILEHELRHASTNIQSAKHVVEFMNAYIRASVENRVIYGKTRQELEGFITDAIQNHWAPMGVAELKKAQTLHNEIDTQEEYQRVSNSCSGQVSKIVSQIRNTPYSPE